MLEELEIDYAVTPIPWTGGATRAPDFLRINPNGKIPALVDGNRVVWESLAINHYLVRKYGGPLAPRSEDEAGQAYRWSFWSMGELEGPIDAVARFGVTLPDDWAAGPLSVLDAALAPGPCLLGDAFSVADLNVAVMFLRPPLAQVDRRPYPSAHAWLKRCKARPAFKRMLERGRSA
jgi:glutathione S-transferase